MEEISLKLKHADVLILLFRSQRAVKHSFLVSVLCGNGNECFIEKYSFKEKVLLNGKNMLS